MKIAFLASTALILTSLAATPALANPAASEPTAAMQAACADVNIVQPDENSTYTSTFSGVLSTTVGDTVVVDRVEIENIPGGTLLRQTPPTYDSSAGLHRSGGSPNIFGTFRATATYSGGKLVEDVTRAYDTKFTFGCTVSKTTTTYTETKVKGVVVSRVVKDTNTTTPGGLQIPGGSNPALEITVRTTLPVQRLIVDNPEDVRVHTSEATVCNSPGTKAGQWRAQNGYTGACSTALFLSLPGKVINSNSLPPLVPMISSVVVNGGSENSWFNRASVTDDEPRSQNEIIEIEDVAGEAPAGEPAGE